MSAPVPNKYAFNRTRCQYLATRLEVAQTHWTRLCGLIATDPQAFRKGCGLWIVPCHGVHTLAMRFAIDAVYLDANNNGQLDSGERTAGSNGGLVLSEMANR